MATTVEYSVESSLWRSRHQSEQLPAWEQLLRAAARLQGILPGATLVGGTAAAIEAGHRQSMDADHVLAGLTGRFDEVLGELETVAGWKTNRVRRPVAIHGSLDGIYTVRNRSGCPSDRRGYDGGPEAPHSEPGRSCASSS
jgi:hypothetical protein